MCYPILSLHKIRIWLLAMTVVIGMLPNAIAATPMELKSEISPNPVLLNAVMCEDVQNQVIINAGVVFPIAIGKISCHSAFDLIPAKIPIYHNWYYRDELSTKIKLLLIPPRWSTVSTIQLREADKGPWRVEITGEDGQVFKTLRFSITD